MSGVKVTQIATGATIPSWSARAAGCGRAAAVATASSVTGINDAGPLQRLEALRGMNVTQAVAGGSHTVPDGLRKRLVVGRAATGSSASATSPSPPPVGTGRPVALPRGAPQRSRRAGDVARGWPPHPLRHRGRPAVGLRQGASGALGIGVKGTLKLLRGGPARRSARSQRRARPASGARASQARAREPAFKRQRGCASATRSSAFEKAFRKPAKETPSDAEGNEDALFGSTPSSERPARTEAQRLPRLRPGEQMRSWGGSAIPQGEEPRGDRALYDDAKKKNAEEDWEVERRAVCGSRFLARVAIGADYPRRGWRQPPASRAAP